MERNNHVLSFVHVRYHFVGSGLRDRLIHVSLLELPFWTFTVKVVSSMYLCILHGSADRRLV